MAVTTRLLVIANRTADSDELFDDLRHRTRSGPVTAMLVLPAQLGREDEARRQLDRALEHIRSAGVEATGTIGDADPVNAALDVWDARSFDEIVVCTLPYGESTWLHIDLPHRLRRMTDATVSHVVARESAPPVRAPVPTREREPWFARLFPISAGR
jgi:hypothetical protein